MRGRKIGAMQINMSDFAGKGKNIGIHSKNAEGPNSDSIYRSETRERLRGHGPALNKPTVDPALAAEVEHGM